MFINQVRHYDFVKKFRVLTCFKIRFQFKLSLIVVLVGFKYNFVGFYES